MNIPNLSVVVLTSDHHNWLLKGFCRQWRRYCPLDVDIYGFTAVNIPGFEFHSLGRFEDYPVQKWSDGLIETLNQTKTEFVLILLEDYWLIRPVNVNAIAAAVQIMEEEGDIARFDVATDRVNCHQARDYGYVDGLDIISTPTGAEYNFSYQASIWSKDKLKKLLVPGESPWESELRGNLRLASRGYKVLGTRQVPMWYAIVMNKGQFDKTGAWMYPARTLYPEDWKDLEENDCLKAN